MTKQTANGRYQVFSHAAYREYPDAAPAGRYDNISDAIEHAESVTYKMAVVDSTSESRGFIYCNWSEISRLSPWGDVQECRTLDTGICKVSTASHGGIWISPERLSALTEMLGYEYPTFCGDSQWFEEDCDWVVPVVAFGIDGLYEPACKQLRAMAKWTGQDRYKRAHDALLEHGAILDVAKVKQAIKHCIAGNSYDFSPSDADPGL